MPSKNGMYYQKVLNKRAAASSKKIDLLFKQARLASESNTAEISVERHSPAPPTFAASDAESATCSTSTSTELVMESDTVSPMSTDTEALSKDCEEIQHITSIKKHILTSQYESNYKWLYYSSSKMGYLCKYCELFADPASAIDMSPFTMGTDLGDHPNRKLSKHDQSQSHIKCVARCQAAVSTNTTTIPALFKKQVSSAQTDVDREINRAYISTLLISLHHVIKSSQSLNSFDGLVELLSDLDCPTIVNFKSRTTRQTQKKHPVSTEVENEKRLSSSKSLNAYTSSYSTTELLVAMDSVFKKQVLDTIKGSQYYTILADESTDEANRTQFAILVRCLSGKEVKEHLLGLVNVKRADAATLMGAIEEFLIQNEVDISKAMFCGFDGCNTMSGENKGLQRRFRHVVPHNIYMNCRNHKLALCVKHLLNKFPVLVDVDGALLSMWKLFEYSPQKLAVFKDVQASYAVKELSLIRAAATRWLSHGAACRRFIDRYVQILDTLDHVIELKREPEIMGLRQMITNKNTVAAILILCDILKPVMGFSEYLQGDVDFTKVGERVKDLTNMLHTLSDRFTDTLRGEAPQDLYFTKLPTIFGEIDNRTVNARRTRLGDDVYTPEQIVHDLAVPMTLTLVTELEDAFHCSPVLQAFSLFNLSQIPDDRLELAVYGNHQITRLIDHYGQQKTDEFLGHISQSAALIDPVRARAEWPGFRDQMQLIKQRKGPGAEVLAVLMEDDIMRRQYPCMFTLVLLSKLVPTSTAVVERVFSLMNTQCTPGRASMLQSTLIAIMRLTREGPNKLTDHNLNEIIEVYKNSKERNIIL